jgi:hypothetical protein
MRCFDARDPSSEAAAFGLAEVADLIQRAEILLDQWRQGKRSRYPGRGLAYRWRSLRRLIDCPTRCRQWRLRRQRLCSREVNNCNYLACEGWRSSSASGCQSCSVGRHRSCCHWPRGCWRTCHGCWASTSSWYLRVSRCNSIARRCRP